MVELAQKDDLLVVLMLDQKDKIIKFLNELK